MHYGKGCLVAIVLSTLISCSSFKEKGGIGGQAQVQSEPLYSLPETVDYEKAAKINIELGLSYLKQDDISRAKSKLARAKRLAPQLPEVHYSYGYFLEHVGEPEEAEKAYQKAISLYPKGGNAHNNYGAFLCRQRQYIKAEKEFLRAMEDPEFLSNAETLENAGLCILQVPDAAKAKEYFEKALRYDAKRPQALLELGILYCKENNIAKAQYYHMRFLQISKPTARSMALAIALANKTGNKEREANYRRLLRSQFPQASATL